MHFTKVLIVPVLVALTTFAAPVPAPSPPGQRASAMVFKRDVELINLYARSPSPAHGHGHGGGFVQAAKGLYHKVFGHHGQSSGSGNESVTDDQSGVQAQVDPSQPGR
ncbi:hypothetical protein FRC18_011899 [Serendipita sp. 400]|nr:hypothetical protein FRC18_011899 [Serendipita sp. 400]